MNRGMRPSATGLASAAGRLAAQQISRQEYATPEELVGWLGAVQAQDYGAAKWALGLRLLSPAATDVSIERSVSEGAIVRIHALRGTWQFVAPADVRWMVSLVAPRLFAGYATRYRELELDAATFRRSWVALTRVLRDGTHLTRAELAAALQRAGIPTAGQRLPYLLQRAELELLTCGGPRRGKQFTYALLDPDSPSRSGFSDRDQALAELARRYFQSRGPATLADFAWWSGLSAADARTGLESIEATLSSSVIDSQVYWHDESLLALSAKAAAYLLPPFDEYLIGYRDRAAALDPQQAKRLNAGGGILGPCVVLGGRVIGTWRRSLSQKAVTIDIAPFAPLISSQLRAITRAAQRYANFLGLALELHHGNRRRRP